MSVKNQNTVTGSEPHSQTSSAEKTSVAVVIPCFNEQDSIPGLKENLALMMEAFSEYYVEIIFVDDGSDDATFELLSDFFASWPIVSIIQHSENQGLMAAIMTGIAATKAEFVCTLDSDCTYDPAQLVELLEKCGPDVGLVTGSPYHPEGMVRNVAAWRIGISQFASRLYRKISIPQLYCYTAMFRCYRSEALEGIRLENKGFVGNTEMLWEIGRRGWRVLEVPSILNVREFGQSKMRIARVTLRHLRLMSKIVRSNLFGRATEPVNQPTNETAKSL
jgi:dolichol-phosphate mannosyltransferase